MLDAYLVLQDGSAFRGHAIGSGVGVSGEVVFNTSMTGYQEVLTDPSYAGQIVMPTYPLIGNYGVNAEDMESARVQVAGFVVREECDTPSHYNSTGRLHDFLARHNVTAISGVDTRAVTRRIRMHGVMMGTIAVSESPERALTRLRKSPEYDSINFVERVTTTKVYRWENQSALNRTNAPHIVVVDCGVKYNILRMLTERNCYIDVVPATISVDTLLAMNPNGVIFSPGPGDPVHNTPTVELAKALVGNVPLFGICLGHQIIARALGANTYKLPFGHRGSNHPVKDLVTGRVQITAQNHGFAVDEENLPEGLVVTHRSLNDGTIEGLRHKEASILTIQYHSEASPGPLDNTYVFDQFLVMLGLEF